MAFRESQQATVLQPATCKTPRTCGTPAKPLNFQACSVNFPLARVCVTGPQTWNPVFLLLSLQSVLTHVQNVSQKRIPVASWVSENPPLGFFGASCHTQKSIDPNSRPTSFRASALGPVAGPSSVPRLSISSPSSASSASKRLAGGPGVAGPSGRNECLGIRPRKMQNLVQ